MAEILKKLPTYNFLKNLKLNLSDNNLGDNPENFIYLGEGLNQLPNSLKYFKLNLTTNNLGKNITGLKYLAKSIK